MPSYNRALAALALFIFVSYVALAFRPPEQLVERPYQEDSFYMFNAAHHLATGHGLSVDGVKPTNGVQPLIVFFYVPFFWLAGADKWLAVKLTFILFALLNVLSMFLIAGTVRHLARESAPKRTIMRASLIAAGLWAFLMHLVQHNGNGLETGLYAALILLGIWYAASRRLFEVEVRPIKGYLLYGAILGLGILARIDGALIVAAAALLRLALPSKDGKRRVVAAFAIGLTALLVSLPWWLFNYFWFGSVMPISGQSESMAQLFAYNLFTGPQIIGDILSTFFYTPFNQYPAWVSFGWFLLNVTIVAVIFRRTHLLKRLRALYSLRPIYPVLIAGILMFIYYVFFFSAPHFLSRYLHPLRIVWIIIVALGTPLVVVDAKMYLYKSGRIRRAFAIVVVAVVAVAALVFNVSRYTKAFTLKDFSTAYPSGLWADRHRDGAIGMTSSGIAGFEADNVINLDGKVNVDALRARQKHRLVEYIVESGMRYIADDRTMVSTIQRDALPLGAHFVIVDSVGSIYMMRRTDSDATTERNNKLWRPL